MIVGQNGGQECQTDKMEFHVAQLQVHGAAQDRQGEYECQCSVQSLQARMCIIYGWHNNLQSKDTLNYVSLVAKYFIFCRIHDNASVNFDSFPAFLKARIDTLKQIALRNKQPDNFYRKWKNFI